MQTWISSAIIGAALFWAAIAGAAPDTAALKDGCAGKLADYTVDQRLNACNRALQAHPEGDRERADMLLLRSVVFNLKGESAAANADIELAFKTSSDIVDQAIGIGRKYLQIKKSDLALAYLNPACQANPHSNVALYLRASAYFLLDKWNLSEKDARAALEDDPGDTDSAQLIISARASSGDVDGALALLNGYVAQHPESEIFYNARCYLRAVANRELGEALADCDAALKIRPRAADVFDSRGLVYLRMGKLAESIADYTAAITLVDNPSPSSFYGRGLAEQQSGNQMSAGADISAAEALSPGIGKKFNTLAMLAE